MDISQKVLKLVSSGQLSAVLTGPATPAFTISSLLRTSFCPSSGHQQDSDALFLVTSCHVRGIQGPLPKATAEPTRPCCWVSSTVRRLLVQPRHCPSLPLLLCPQECPSPSTETPKRCRVWLHPDSTNTEQILLVRVGKLRFRLFDILSKRTQELCGPGSNLDLAGFPNHSSWCLPLLCGVGLKPRASSIVSINETTPSPDPGSYHFKAGACRGGR